MRFIDRAAEWLFRVIARQRGRVVAAIGSVSYVGVGLLLPLVLGWTPIWFVTANLLGTLFAAAALLSWLVVQIEARDRRHLVEWTTDLRHLNAAEFEWFLGELFRRDGWSVEETGSQDGPDGNVDLVLTKGRDRRIVQAKRWVAYDVGVAEIRQFAGTLAGEGLPMSAGTFATLRGYTSHAMAEAQRVGIHLMDGRDVYSVAERMRRAEPCPVCGSAMILDRSQRGWWFRCVNGVCTGKRDLGRDPVRAVELLTDMS